MTVQKTITIEVSMFSEASEAALKEHFRSFVAEIEANAKNMRFKSWYMSLPVDWDKSYPVQIDVEVSTK
jgi:hypothetical protein